MQICGAVEAGGTKFVCAVGTGPADLSEREVIPTTTPAETLARVIAYFRKHGPVAAMGLASFGPVNVDPSSSGFGRITSTPKPGWRDVDLAGTLRTAFPVPIGFDTDVNGAALGEGLWGAGRGLHTFAYLTIGTGIGGGGLIEGRRMHGLLHPEMGHMRIPRVPGDQFAGTCPFHGDCWEGMASGPAIAARWGQPAASLPPDHPAWELEAEYLALGVMNIICTLSPQRIILGGGVMHQPALFPRIRTKVLELLHGYVQAEALLNRSDEFIVPPGLGDNAGILGALALAREAALRA
jgi:fructokinase